MVNHALSLVAWIFAACLLMNFSMSLLINYMYRDLCFNLSTIFLNEYISILFYLQEDIRLFLVKWLVKN